jgi:uncharacterized membrane protein
MRTARAAVFVPGPIAAVEALWYDLDRWPAWIDGFANVAVREGDWPRAGSRLVWDSRPSGRGRVVERVAAFEARVGQVADVEDEQLSGRQEITFALKDERVRVELSLEYALKREGALVPVADVLFIRRALRDSLRRTMDRFAREYEGERDLAAPATH